MNSKSTLITFEADDIKNDLQRNGCIESNPVKFLGLSWCIIVSKFTSIDGVKSVCVGVRCHGPSKYHLLPKNRFVLRHQNEFDLLHQLASSKKMVVPRLRAAPSSPLWRYVL